MAALGSGLMWANMILVSPCVDSDGLDRVQRLLTTHGIFQRQHGIFGHTSSSLLLRSDHPRTMRAFAQVMCNATVLVVEDLMPEEHLTRAVAPRTSSC